MNGRVTKGVVTHERAARGDVRGATKASVQSRVEAALAHWLAKLADGAAHEARIGEQLAKAAERAGLVMRDGANVRLTAAGEAYLRRAQAKAEGALDPFRAQHMALARVTRMTAHGAQDCLVDDNESPLGWLARRKGRDGRALIDEAQFQAGERLRADFTRGQMTPRITANWSASVASGRRGADGASDMTDLTIAARQRVQRALDAVGPELAGLLLDVCCFLKGLEDVERERGWPTRSAKVVLQLGLDRLARHYGLIRDASGERQTRTRIWLAPDARFHVE